MRSLTPPELIATIPTQSDHKWRTKKWMLKWDLWPLPSRLQPFQTLCDLKWRIRKWMLKWDLWLLPSRLQPFQTLCDLKWRIRNWMLKKELNVKMNPWSFPNPHSQSFLTRCLMICDKSLSDVPYDNVLILYSNADKGKRRQLELFTYVTALKQNSNVLQWFNLLHVMYTSWSTATMCVMQLRFSGFRISKWNRVANSVFYLVYISQT